MSSLLPKKGTKRASCYQPLWEYLRDSGEQELRLSFDEIAAITGRPFDAMFLLCRKELLDYGYCDFRLSTRDKAVSFRKIV